MVPLFNDQVLLEKFAGKGGWTYARLPGVPPGLHTPFGWVRVNGSVDGYPLQHYHLQSMGNGMLFLPIRSQVRKAIGKQAGDVVQVLLYRDDTPVGIPEELKECLLLESGAMEKFLRLCERDQIKWVNRIYSAKQMETKTQRIVELIKNLTAVRK